MSSGFDLGEAYDRMQESGDDADPMSFVDEGFVDDGDLDDVPDSDNDDVDAVVVDDDGEPPEGTVVEGDGEPPPEKFTPAWYDEIDGAISSYNPAVALGAPRNDPVQYQWGADGYIYDQYGNRYNPPPQNTAPPQDAKRDVRQDIDKLFSYQDIDIS